MNTTRIPSPSDPVPSAPPRTRSARTLDRPAAAPPRLIGRRLPALGAATLALVVAGSLLGAGAAQAATTRTVIWQVTSPTGFADRFATPQILADDTSGCGLFQVDVYRYTTPAEIALVDRLVARGTLAGPEDGPVFVSNTDITSTAACAPATPPALTPRVTPTLPTAACVPAADVSRARTASFVLDNGASDAAATYTVNGTSYAVAAGASQTVRLPVAAAGTTFAITAADESWDYTVQAARACPAPTVTVPVTPRTRTTTTVPAAVTPGTPISGTPVVAAADTTTPVGTDAAAAAAGTLAYTGTDHLAEKLSAGGGAVLLGLGLMLADRRRRGGARTRTPGAQG